MTMHPIIRWPIAQATIVLCLCTAVRADEPAVPQRHWLAVARSAERLKAVTDSLDDTGLLVLDPVALTRPEQLQQLKKDHPHLKVVAVLDVGQRSSADPQWKLVDANETWFYHDTQLKRVRVLNPRRRNVAGATYAMNLADLRYRAHCLQQVLTAKRQGFDAVLLEGVSTLDPFGPGRASGRPVTGARGEEPAELTWGELFGDLVGFLASVRKGTPKGFPIYIDGVHAAAPLRSAQLLKLVDGAVVAPEVMRHGDVVTNLFEPRQKLIAGMIDRGQAVLMLSTTRPDAEGIRLDRQRSLALAGMLLSMSARTYINLPGIDPAEVNRPVAKLGRPKGGASQSDDGLWRRAFGRGAVTVNVSDKAVVGLPPMSGRITFAGGGAARP